MTVRLAQACPTCGSNQVLFAGLIREACVCRACGQLFVPEHRVDPAGQLCDDCAFRPGSPERADGYKWAEIIQATIVDQLHPFYCHKGLTCELRDGSLYYRLHEEGKAPLTTCAGWLAHLKAYQSGTPGEEALTMTRALQKLVHIGCRDLGIDGETRRDLQLLVTGKASMTDMTEADLSKLVTALKERGFKPLAGKFRSKRPAAKRADVRFAHVLWGKLHTAKAVDQAGAKGLNAFIRARFGAAWGAAVFDIDQMQDHRQIATLIEALKAMCARAGISL